MATISEADPKFPAFGFVTAASALTETFRDLEQLKSWQTWMLEKGFPNGMELVDASGASWRVRSFHVTGYKRNWPFKAHVTYIEFDLEPIPAVPLAEMKRRLLEEVQENPTFFGLDCHDHGEGLAELLAQIAAAPNVADLYAVIAPDGDL